jgi:uncharacterized protein YbjT (DUF2867 family)
MADPPELLSHRPVLVTGATGYIGGRLVPRLLDAGFVVRCLARSPRKLESRAWIGHERLEVIQGDVGDVEATRAAMAGCGAAFYLVHSMRAAGADNRERDRQLATRFSEAAADADLGRIVYLGGLGETGSGLSQHLAARREVESALRGGSVPVTVLRAAMIIGSGSASFEILRYLVERLPLMITPSWVRTPCQPIAVRDVLRYLVTCLSTPETVGRSLEIGGPDVLTYQEFMHLVAEVRGLPRRLMLPVPVQAPRLSSLWIHLITPVSRRIARPLASGLRNPVVCQDDAATTLMPFERTTVRDAVSSAFSNLEQRRVETAWSDAGPIPGDPDWAGGRVFVDRRTLAIRASAERVYDTICRIGGGHGYYAADWLWRLRGRMDRIVGGPGLRRGRKDPRRVAYGEALDFWRVTDVEQGRRLSLRAEMKLPGDASLEFEITRPDPDGGGVSLVQTARFIPRGLLGLAYWYAVLPLHHIVFRGMMDGIRRVAERAADQDPVRDRSAL